MIEENKSAITSDNNGPSTSVTSPSQKQDEHNQTVSEILSLLSESEPTPLKQSEIEKKFYDRSESLRAPKASKVPIF